MNNGRAHSLTATKSQFARRSGVLLLAAGLVLAACGDDDDAGTADGTVLDVSVEGGEVTGGGRQEVALGETVTIRVTSDVADHVHLHGYDVFADVPAGGPPT